MERKFFSILRGTGFLGQATPPLASQFFRAISTSLHVFKRERSYCYELWRAFLPIIYRVCSICLLIELSCSGLLLVHGICSTSCLGRELMVGLDFTPLYSSPMLDLGACSGERYCGMMELNSCLQMVSINNPKYFEEVTQLSMSFHQNTIHQTNCNPFHKPSHPQGAYHHENTL